MGQIGTLAGRVWSALQEVVGSWRYGALMFDIPGMPAPGPKHLPARRPLSAPAWLGAPSATPGHERQLRPGWQPRSSAEQWWHYSRAAAAALRAGHPPPPMEVYGPVLEPGEHALLSTEIGYSRYCATKARYSPLPLVVGGRPAVMFGALALQGVINHRRKVAAERKAPHQWRFHQTSPVIVTTDRLLCNTSPHGLLSFWFGACTEFYPDLSRWTLTLGFESTYPVRLSGPAAPALSLWTAYGVLGDAWVGDPRLTPLLT
jgi:hypothetical protein